MNNVVSNLYDYGSANGVVYNLYDYGHYGLLVVYKEEVKVNKRRKRRGRLGDKRKKLHAENPRCFYCGKKLKFDESSLDHRVPRSKGGGNKNNLVLCCKPCNYLKGNRLIPEGMSLFEAVNFWTNNKIRS